MHVRALRKRSAANVVFIATDPSIWHAQTVYEAMLKDSRFNPIIVVYPSERGYSEGLAGLEKAQSTYKTFVDQGLNPHRGWRGAETGFDIIDPKEFAADILFYSSPYKLSDDRLHKLAWSKYLCCYIPYGLSISRDNRLIYDMAFHNAMWRIYCPDQFHLDGHKAHQRIRGRNCVVTGYPSMDLLQRPDAASRQLFDSKGRLHLIWAPHHTITAGSGSLPSSNFLQVAESMKELADKYATEIFWAFRPHPALKLKLYEAPGWGKAKTDAYYTYWQSADHAALSKGDYISLFKWSDALVHDCGSFLVEYSYTGKPVLYLRRHAEVAPFLSELAMVALKKCKLGATAGDVEQFLDELVLLPQHPSSIQLEQVTTHCTVAEKILGDLRKSIWGLNGLS